MDEKYRGLGKWVKGRDCGSDNGHDKSLKILKFNLKLISLIFKNEF